MDLVKVIYGDQTSDEIAETAAAFVELLDKTPIFVRKDVNGFCLDAGFELALACDLRVATEGSEFGNPEINLGFVPGGGATQRLTRLIGETRTKEFVFGGKHIDADRAYEWGILNRVVEPKALEETVTEFVDNLVRGPPIGLKVAKNVINEGQETNLDSTLALES